MAQLTSAERETTIGWDEESKQVRLYSASRMTWAKAEKLGIKPVKVSHLRDGTECGRFYRIPLDQFRWGLKSKAKSAAKGNLEGLRRAKEARDAKKAAESGDA